MEIRKEPLVLVGTLGVLGWLGWSLFQSQPARRAGSVKGANAPQLREFPAPTLEGLEVARSEGLRAPRELFSPPSDTRPLPPLEYLPPPMPAPLPLMPPPHAEPAARLHGKLLRRPMAALELPALFGSDAPMAAADSKSAAAAGSTELGTENRLAGYKKLFDWYRTVDFRFGQILNPERFALSRRPNEPLLFVEYDPIRGVPKIPGAAPVAVERKSVTEFGFADTIPNRLEQRRAEFGDPLAVSEYEKAISFAYWCIENRHESPRALVVAEEMFRRASKVLGEDPAPRLGLARCHEAAFDFEKAFQEYRSLLETSRNPLVMVRLAELEARFRLYDAARGHFEEAIKAGRTQWAVQQAYGRFLLSRGSHAAAIEHLRLANQFEPTGPESQEDRARLRSDLALALVSNGALDEGLEWADKALQALPEDDEALAIRISVLALRGGSGNTQLEVAEAEASLLLSMGVQALAVRTPEGAQRARQLLEQAAQADPLRSVRALRALSWLAETTGNPEQALSFAQEALENDPQDVWSLYQRGRLAVQRDDLEGAAEYFARALEQELDCADVLGAVGDLEYRQGNHVKAERYLERALTLEPKNPLFHALRGQNQVQLGLLRDAETSFRAALSVNPDDPVSRAGMAWCAYRNGQADEAITRLRELDDNRRSQPETDPYRKYAVGEIARIQDHVQKVAWTDRFERTNLMNGWEVEERNGPQVTIHDGVVTLAGSFKNNGRARLWREIGAASFVALEMKLNVRSETTARVGIFVSRESVRGGESQVEAEAVIVRHNEPGRNVAQTRLMKRGEEDMPYNDVVGLEWKFDAPVTVRIERIGDSSDTRMRILLDGFAVVEGKSMPTLAKTNQPLRLGLFAEGASGKKVSVDIDDVEVVFRQSN